MKLVIHQGALSERGDSVNAENIALGLLENYGIESLITAPDTKSNNLERIREIQEKGLRVELYRDLNDLWGLAKKFKASHSYFMIDGRYSNLWIPETVHLSHCVFRPYEPHGDKYAYVSEWLLRKARRSKNTIDWNAIEELQHQTNSPHLVRFNMDVSWVPHSVNPVIPTFGAFRSKYGFKKNEKLICRIGGFDQFNDKAALTAVGKIVEKHPSIKFIFVNTRKFLVDPNVIYLDYLSEKEKWSMYRDCDLFLNGRSMGESFGFSIVEPLSVGKPVLAPDQLRHPRMDAHHMHLLRPLGLTYLSDKSLERKIYTLLDNDYNPESIKESVEKYSMKNSTSRFYEYFLS